MGSWASCAHYVFIVTTVTFTVDHEWAGLVIFKGHIDVRYIGSRYVKTVRISTLDDGDRGLLLG